MNSYDFTDHADVLLVNAGRDEVDVLKCEAIGLTVLKVFIILMTWWGVNWNLELNRGMRS